MIFITLGSQKFQFNRLLQKLDKLVLDKIIQEEIFAQIGFSDYKPLYYEYKQFMDRTDFVNRMKQSNIVITHAGTGAIIGAIKEGKKVIAVPRLVKHGEHVDDHQIQIIKQFDEMNLICACYDVEELCRAIEVVQNRDYLSYVSNTEKIIKSIEDYIEQLEK